jgi:hypothetical protein
MWATRPGIATHSLALLHNERCAILTGFIPPRCQIPETLTLSSKEVIVNFQSTGPVWDVSMTHGEVNAGNWSAALAAAGAPNPVTIAIAAATQIVSFIDFLGGDNGVDITGILGVQGCIITPHTFGIFGVLSQATKIVADAGRTIGDFLVKAVGDGSKAVSIALCVSIGTIIAGPVGGLIGGLLSGLFGGGNQPQPPTPARGGVAADTPVNQPITGVNKFILCQNAGGAGVTLLSWQGFFCPQRGGGTSILANTDRVGQYEQLVMENNGDGTVSFRADSTGTSFYFRAMNGGGNVCQWDTTNPGVGVYHHRNALETSFRILHLENGNIALQTYNKQYYVRVSQ